MRLVSGLGWMAVAMSGVGALAFIALSRGETLSSTWFLVAALAIYAIGYRFYSAFLAAKALSLDDARRTPAHTRSDGKDFVATNRWVVFGHHFAAIAGPGPLVGPILAAQFGYLPGTLYIVIGVVLGGAVQDFTILVGSMRRGGRSLGQIVREEIGPVGGAAALVGVLAIMVILIGVLGLVVVNAMFGSPWATFTVVWTLPVAVAMGLYMVRIRPGRVLEATVGGVALVLLGVVAGGWVRDQETLRAFFDLDKRTIALGLRLPRGKARDLSQTTVRGVYVSDMIAHNNDRERDIFQISPGNDAGSMWLAYQAHLANEIWNESVPYWNKSQKRDGLPRGRRSPNGAAIPEAAPFLAVSGHVRVPSDPRSTLYNTDGQIFSDAGVPVVLFMENYDINRTGYHDTHDTMENIDLDYGAAVCAITIEAVARAASSKKIGAGILALEE